MPNSVKDYQLIEKKTIKSLSSYRGERIIFKDCEFKFVTLNGRSDFKSLTFLSCTLKHFTLKDIKCLELIFVDCYARAFSVRFCKKLHIKLVGSTLDNSFFLESSFHTFNSSNKEMEFFSNASDGHRESSIKDTEFRFCECKHLHADNTTLNAAKIKHCIIEDLCFTEGVYSKFLDLRGTKIINANLKGSQFTRTIYKKQNIFGELKEFGTLINSKLGYLQFKSWKKYRRDIKEIKEEANIPKLIIRQSRNEIEEDAFIRLKEKQNDKKKKNYKKKCRWIRKIVDSSSSTTFEKPVNLDNNTLAEDYFFRCHIQDQNHIRDLKRKHPIFALLMFMLADYLRSLTAILVRLIAVILLFSSLYYFFSSFEYDPTQTGNILTPTVYPFGRIESFLNSIPVSFKTFISLEACAQPANGITKAFMVCERLIGYFYLSILIAKITNEFSRRS